MKVKSTAIPTLLCDFYKVGHKDQYVRGTTHIYSTWTPRANHYLPQVDRIVQFGLQGFIKKYLIGYFDDNFFNRKKEEVTQEFEDFIERTLGKRPNSDHIAKLHDLGYLPIRIKAIEEGKSVLPKIPTLTIENTHPDFYWITNYLETLLSTCLWQPSTSASIARQYKKILSKYAKETCDNLDHLAFQSHDFSMRGMSSLESAETSGAGHLTSFLGTDTIPAINYVEAYYPTNDLVGCSIPATEHSVMSSHGLNELETFRYLIEEVYPEGFVSIVSDTYDFWKNVTETLPILKDKILSRKGKVVIRPDSGDPVDIICGTEKIRSNELLLAFQGTGYFYSVTGEVQKVTKDGDNVTFEEDDRTAEQKGLIECLWETFGGTVNSKGYKVLDEHIGAIYGDSITMERADIICHKLKEKGFASSNIVFGVGSYTYQYLTRDSLGYAVKSTWAKVNGNEVLIYKDPKTDSGVKKSQKGRVAVFNNGTQLQDHLTLESENYISDNELELVFENGELIKLMTFNKIRENINSQLDL